MTDKASSRGRDGGCRGAAARALLAAAMAAGLAACASGPGGGRTGSAGQAESAATAPKALERRAVERWQLLIDGKPEEAYEYLTPGYRLTRNQDAYMERYRPGVIRWRSVEWRGADCAEADSCEVRLLLTYTVAMPSAGEGFSVRELKERWLRVKGQWYHFPDR